MKKVSEISIENRIVCFIDILGFKAVVEEYERTKDTSIVAIIQNGFREALNVITKFSDPEHVKMMNLDPENTEDIVKDIYFKTFSDNIVITIKYTEIDDSFFRRLGIIMSFSSAFQFELMRNGVYTRGGVSFGSFFSDENIIFSSALTRAYELEVEKAIYPRIVVDPEISNLVDSKTGEYVPKNLILWDQQGVAFIPPFGLMDSTADLLDEAFREEIHVILEKYSYILDSLPESVRNAALNPIKTLTDVHKKIIADIIGRATNADFSERVRIKYEWLNEFYLWRYHAKESKFGFRKTSSTK